MKKLSLHQQPRTQQTALFRPRTAILPHTSPPNWQTWARSNWI